MGRDSSDQSIYIIVDSSENVTYTSMYHGFLAADRRRTKPPGAVTRYSSATSESASTLPGENQSRWSMITARVIDRDGSPRRTLEKGERLTNQASIPNRGEERWQCNILEYRVSMKSKCIHRAGIVGSECLEAFASQIQGTGVTSVSA